MAAVSSGWSSGGSTSFAGRGGRDVTVSPRASTARRLIPERDFGRFFVLELTPPGESASKSDLVCVLQVAADGEAARERRDPHRQISYFLGYEHSRRLPCGVGVGGDDYLFRPLLPDPLDELCYPQVLGLYAVERREGAAEHVVEAPVFVRALYRADVVGVLYHTDRAPVAPCVAADLTLLTLCEVE